MKSQIVTQDAVFQPKYMEVAKAASEGVYLKYGKIAAYATYAYDSATALLKAIKAAGSTEPAKIKAELMKLDYQGVAKHIKFGPKGDSGSSYIAFKVVGDKFVPYWEPENGLIK